VIRVLLELGGVEGDLGPLLERAVQAAVDAHGAGPAREGSPTGEISLTFLDDDAIRRLNREYLDHDRVTDVISFSLPGPDGSLVGDVYVGLDQARRQAKEATVTLEEELVRLAIHGTLHVLGQDHPEGEDRQESPMFQLQERLVRQVLSAG
jgi:probable rRNA maturation factor